MSWRPRSNDGGRLLQISHNIVLAHEDKTYAGAFIASASIPWGYAKGDDDLGGYHLVWTRDMVHSASALLACGRVDTARRALVYLACTQHPHGGFAQNFWVNGTPYWTGIQLDEVAFPIILAWRLWKVDGLAKFDVFPFVERGAAFLVRYAPVTQQERWEENAGYSPSTLAAVIAALICAAEIVRAHGSAELAEFLEEHADWIEGTSGRMDGHQRWGAASGGKAALTCGFVRRSAATLMRAKAAETRWCTSTTARRASRRSSRRGRSSMPDSWNWCGMACGGRMIR